MNRRCTLFRLSAVVPVLLLTLGCQGPQLTGSWRSLYIQGPQLEEAAEVTLDIRRVAGEHPYLALVRVTTADGMTRPDMVLFRTDMDTPMEFHNDFFGQQKWNWSLQDGGSQLNLYGDDRKLLSLVRAD